MENAPKWLAHTLKRIMICGNARGDVGLRGVLSPCQDASLRGAAARRAAHAGGPLAGIRPGIARSVKAGPWSEPDHPDQGLFVRHSHPSGPAHRIPQKLRCINLLGRGQCSHGGLRLGSCSQSAFLPSSGPLAARQCVALFRFTPSISPRPWPRAISSPPPRCGQLLGARPADCVRHLADKDQHARRADRHVRRAGDGASGAASNSSTKMTAAVMLVPAIYRLA